MFAELASGDVAVFAVFAVIVTVAVAVAVIAGVLGMMVRSKVEVVMASQ